MAAAAVVVLAVVPFLRALSADDLLAGEVVSSHVRSLMASHLADVRSSNQHTVKPWFAGKLDFAPPVENLAANHIHWEYKRLGKMMKIAKTLVLGGLLGLAQGSPAPAHEWASVKILSAGGNVRLEGLNQRYGSVPELSLVERSGKTINLAALRGKVWVADFIYTSCTDTCPLQTVDMAKLQEQWKKNSDFESVSFSVDPERDTPRALTRYAERFNADAKRWLFLTAGRGEIARSLPTVGLGDRRWRAGDKGFAAAPQRDGFLRPYPPGAPLHDGSNRSSRGQIAYVSAPGARITTKTPARAVGSCRPIPGFGIPGSGS